ncbi:MAG: PAS domain S-box protein, partial [Candidatus Marinimicrobia bacterium]|nr:PAS domain S-box protein [Candidatus Neomarinimicrobiota bacterium]
MNTKSKENGDTELGSLRKRVNSLSNLLKTQEKEFESTRRQIDATENLYIDLCVEIGDILFYLDEDNRFLDIQAKPGVPLFQQPQEFIGKKIEDVIPSDVAEKYFSALEKLTPGNPQTFQYSLSINGNLYSFMATLNRSAIDNKTVAKIRNITRYKNVEKELQRETTLFEILFNNSPESIVLTEKDGSVLRVNKEFENMFGFNRNEVRGENIDRLIAPEELLSEAQQITSQIVQNKKIHEEAKRRRKDGSTLFVSILGATVDIEEENKIVFCIYRDI